MFNACFKRKFLEAVYGNGQLITDSLRKTGVLGFVVSASTALCLFDKLVKEQQQLKYLLTYKFNQDHLELLLL